MKTQYKLGDKKFTYKSEIDREIRRILYHTEPFAMIQSRDATFLDALLRRHPNYATKAAGGVRGHYVVKTRQGSRRFDIVRSDGSTIDWSPFKVVRNLSKDKEQQQRDYRRDQVTRAMREAIQDQAAEVWQRYAEQNPGATRQEFHVDHAPPRTFNWLLAGFLRTNWINYHKIPLRQAGLGVAIADDAIRQKWQEYHRHHAELRILPAAQNIRLGGHPPNWEMLEAVAWLCP